MGRSPKYRSGKEMNEVESAMLDEKRAPNRRGGAHGWEEKVLNLRSEQLGYR